MGAEQMERSLLARKEREELAAIASSLGVKSNARTKKEDLVDRILSATGVGETAAPKRVTKAASADAKTTSVEASTPVKRGRGRVAKAEGDDVPSTSSESKSSSNELIILPDASSNAPAPARMNRSNNSHGADPDSGESQPSEGGQQRGGRDNQQGGQRFESRNNQQGGNNQAGNNANAGADRNARRGRRGRNRNGRPQDGFNNGGGNRTEFEPQPEQNWTGETIECSGYLEMRDEGFGFLRTNGFLASNKDVYVPIGMVRRFGLRKGDHVVGGHKPQGSQEKFPALVRIDKVMDLDPEEARKRPRFEDLTPLFPDVKLKLENPADPSNLTARIIDLISPIGKGQRGLIVSPPKAGKTTVMKQIATSIEANNPEVELMVLLVDERPEEVTDMRRTVKGTVVASTFDRPSDEHTAVAELTIERAKRLVELGKDVVIILDGITRLARAYNISAPASGRIMSGGIDTGALYPPKKFFGSARNTEEGGSLTILATALVETGSKMDEVIFEEFKGTGNMELRLDRRLAERRIYPALDVNASSTRHEELLFERTQLQQVWKLRRVLNGMGSDGTAAAALELLIDKLKSTKTNDQFIDEIAKTASPGA